MNTADLHLKRLPLQITVAELRQLSEELTAMEHAPHQAPMSADKQIEWDRAGETLSTHVAMLVSETRGAPDNQVLADSIPLLRVSAKYLFTAYDRCRRRALRSALGAEGGEMVDALSTAKHWDDLMRSISVQHGVTSPLRGLVEPIVCKAQDLDRLGLHPGTLLNGDEVLSRR